MPLRRYIELMRKDETVHPERTAELLDMLLDRIEDLEEQLQDLSDDMALKGNPAKEK